MAEESELQTIISGMESSANDLEYFHSLSVRNDFIIPFKVR